MPSTFLRRADECWEAARSVTSQGEAPGTAAEAAVRATILTTLQHEARTIAHTLGNPLTGLSLTLELLAGTTLSPAQHRYVERCLRVMERLVAFKTGLGRVGRGAVGPLEPVRLDEAIGAVLERLRPGDAYDLAIELDPAAAWVLGEPELMGQVLTHLLRNAFEALGDSGSLGLRSSAAGHRVRLTIWDAGPGLHADALEGLWRRPIPGKAHGSGLGLFWAATTVEHALGGTLQFTPRRPHGAAFHIDLDAPEPGAVPL